MRKTKYQKTGQILYRVLPADALTKEQQQIIDAQVKDIKTGDEAQKLAGTGSWAYRKIGQVERAAWEVPLIMPGTLGILTFNGAEVALFYKRKTVSVQSEECDPVPPYAIKDPNEAWVRIEFLHARSSAIRTSWYSEIEAEYNKRIKELQGLVGSLTIENNAINDNILQLQKKEEEQTIAIGRFKDRMKKSASRNATLQNDLDDAFKRIGVLEKKLKKQPAKKTRKKKP